MKNYIKILGLSVVFAIIFAFTITTGIASTNQGHPFKQGEIVVDGPPGAHTQGLTIVKYLPNANLTVVQVENGKEFGLIQRFSRQGRRAGLNYLAHASFVPDDQYYNPVQWNFQSVQAQQAWDLTSGSGIVVAVLDTGLTVGGPDGLTCVASPYDVVNGDFFPEDGDGHGTHVSGTIGQVTNNGIGVAGLAYDACIMPVKVLDDSGSGTFADISDGIYWAVNNGARVINMSLGTNARYGVTSDIFMDAALDYAYNQGVTVVCAAGNDGNRKNVSYPAIYPTTIGVGATDYSNRVTRYSNRGDGLDLVAPGGDTFKDQNGDGYLDGILQETYINGWNYYFFQGTSMAAPHVAAASALLLAYDPALSPLDIFNALTATALNLYEAGYDTTSGYGLIQIYNALTGEKAGGTDPGTGSGTDIDGDGWTVENGDCDDTDNNVYPGHQDSKGKWGRDGIDNDCNGIIDG